MSFSCRSSVIDLFHNKAEKTYEGDFQKPGDGGEKYSRAERANSRTLDAAYAAARKGEKGPNLTHKGITYTHFKSPALPPLGGYRDIWVDNMGNQKTLNELGDVMTPNMYKQNEYNL